MNRREFVLYSTFGATLLGSGCATFRQNAMMPASPSLIHALEQIAFDPKMPLASLAVALIKNGAVYALHAVDNRPAARKVIQPRLTPDALFRVASISKLICAIGAMRLVEQGVLALDADVSELLGWTLRNPHFPDVPITIAQLLSHTSSLRDDGGYNFPPETSLQSALERNAKVWGTQGPPGEYFRYANVPWGVLATVMERATHERFDRLITRLVFAPLGIEGGFHPFEFAPKVLQSTETLYRKRDANEVWNPAGPWIAQVDDYSATPPAPRASAGYVLGTNGTVMSPQGGARLSVVALAKIARLLLGKGEVDGVRLLKAETVTMMCAKRWDAKRDKGDSDFDEGVGSIAGWGLGVQHFNDTPGPKGDRLIEGGGFTGVGHFGFAYGLTSGLVIDPISGNGLIYCQGGTGDDPEKNKGIYSSNYRFEERIFTALAQAL